MNIWYIINDGNDNHDDDDDDDDDNDNDNDKQERLSSEDHIVDLFDNYFDLFKDIY